MRRAIMALAVARALAIGGTAAVPPGRGRRHRPNRAFLQAAFSRSGVPFVIQNAKGDKTAFRRTSSPTGFVSVSDLCPPAREAQCVRAGVK